MKEQNFLRMFKAQQCFPKFNVLYKDVESCTITYTRTADGPGGNYSDPQPRVKKVNVLSDSAMVTIECINSDCTKEYFDLRSEIGSMVSCHEQNKTGVMYCDGWQDEERKGINQCLCKLEYEIHIEYKSL